MSGPLDPRNYGAVLDGNSHPLSTKYSTLAAAQAAFPGVYIPSLNCELDRCAIQLAVNTAGRNGSVYVSGSGLLDYPIFLTNGQFKLFGDGSQQSFLANSPLVGACPLIIICPPTPWYQPVSLGSSLVSGPGGSYLLDGSNDSWLNFADIGSLPAISSNVLTFEFWLMLTALPSSYRSVLYLGGSLGAASNGIVAFSFGVNADSIVIESNITNNNVPTDNLFHTTLGNLSTLNQAHHVAVVLNNAVWTVYVDGVKQTVTSGTDSVGSGNLTIVPYLDFIVGQMPATWPDTGNLNNTVSGAIDGIRISTVARYTANFTPPTSKFSPGQDFVTFLICNFDQVNGFLVGGYKEHSTLPSYTWQRYGPFGGSLPNVSIEGLNLSNSNGCAAIVGIACNNSYLNDIYVGESNYGVYYWRNTYYSTITNVILNGTTAALVLANQSVDTTVENATLNSGGNGFGLVSVIGGSSYKNIASSGNRIHYLISNDQGGLVRLENIFLDVENPPYPERFMYIYQVLVVVLASSNIYYPGGTYAPITVDTGNSVAIRDCVFYIGSSAPSYGVAVVNPGSLAGPVTISNSQLLTTSTSWSNTLDYIRLAEVDGTPLVHLADASTVNINLAMGSNFILQMTSAVGASRTLTVSYPTVGQNFSIKFQQPASGGPCTATFFSGITWKGGSQPSFSTNPNAIDKFEFDTLSTTPTFYGALD